MHDKDAWGCGFCASLLTTWEERCEHIALHFEEKRSKWNFTNVILGLLKQPDVSQAWNLMLAQRFGEQHNWPQLTWESKKCNRLRYKLETKWDTRVFDVEKLVQETFDLAEVEPTENTEASEPVEPTEVSEPIETVDCKIESFDFPNEQRLSSSHGIPPENSMMDLDPVEPMQSVSQADIQETPWPVSTNMTQTSLSTDVSMDAFGGYTSHLSSMSTDFTQQPVSQAYQQPSWPNAGFVSTPDLVNFQQPNAYMNYAPTKEVIQVPTSQYANFARPTSQHTSHHSNPNFAQFPRQSVPPNFLHHPSTAGVAKIHSEADQHIEPKPARPAARSSPTSSSKR